MLDALSKEIFEANKAKGFWPDDPKERNRSECLMLIVSELAEAQEALRSCSHFKNIGTKELLDEWCELHDNGSIDNDEFRERFQYSAKDTHEDEIADALIRILDYCGAHGIAIESHVRAKLKYNSLRPHKHGKVF